MNRRTAVVTGGNRGIGYAVGEALAQQGFRVVLVIRDRTEAERVHAALDVEVVHGDLSSRRAVTAAATALQETCPAIDVLVHNAGVWPTRLVHNEDGIEQSFAVNHLAPFQLNLALAPRLRRVVQVSAGLYVKGQVDPQRTPAGANFHRMRTYCDTKLANLMLVPLFARHWQDAGVTIDAVHPGVIRTRLGDPGGPLALVLRAVKLGWQPPATGAKPITRLAAASTTGCYYNINEETPLAPIATDAELAGQLWHQALKLTGSDAG